MNDKKFGVGVGVMVLRDGKILLGKRNDDPEKASSILNGQGTWTMPGGKLDFGEKLIDCVYREALEECGIKINRENTRVVSISDDFSEDAHFTTVGFFCDVFEGEPYAAEPEKIVEWRWFDLNDLPSPLFLPTERLIKNYLDKIIYKN
ncbi:MAG: NUDIX domain-containing protein [Patescibacteria group bacterium]|jgi:8-oxo-dGTP diphosphatase